MRSKGWAGMTMNSEWQMIGWSKIMRVETDMYGIDIKPNVIGKNVIKRRLENHRSK
jgi:hypothetical protein